MSLGRPSGGRMYLQRAYDTHPTSNSRRGRAPRDIEQGLLENAFENLSPYGKPLGAPSSEAFEMDRISRSSKITKEDTKVGGNGGYKTPPGRASSAGITLLAQDLAVSPASRTNTPDNPTMTNGLPRDPKIEHVANTLSGETFTGPQDTQVRRSSMNTEDRTDPESRDPWSLCAEKVWDYEIKMVAKWKDDIANLLVFDGLFMTILTGFIVAFYPTLRPDPQTEVLLVISAQLSIVTANIGQTTLTNEQQASLKDASASATLTSFIISTNTLWFAAMICGISAASIAIAVSQWLHHHLDRPSTMSHRNIHMWWFRRRGLTKWEVQFIIDMLPLLLQVSMALFLIGLLQFLWTLNRIVAVVSTALVVTLLAPSLLSVFVPAFAPDCPYKSRAAWWSFCTLQWLVSSLYRLKAISFLVLWKPSFWLSSSPFKALAMWLSSVPARCARLWSSITDHIVFLPYRILSTLLRCLDRLTKWTQWYLRAEHVTN